MLVKDFASLTLKDIAAAGGKNASLGEMITTLGGYGIHIPKGFAVLSEGYHLFLQENNLAEKLERVLQRLDHKDLSNLGETASRCRKLIAEGKLPDALREAVLNAYRALAEGQVISVAVRSSATAEDIPSASFAGQQRTTHKDM